MNILGLNYIFRDSAACLLKNGEIAFAVEEERLSRQKHTQCFPRLSVKETLQQTGTRPDEIDHTAVSINPDKSDGHKLRYASALNGARAPFLEHEFDRLKERNLVFWDWYHSISPKDANKQP